MQFQKELIKKCKGLGFQNLKLYAGDVKKLHENMQMNTLVQE